VRQLRRPNQQPFDVAKDLSAAETNLGRVANLLEQNASLAEDRSARERQQWHVDFGVALLAGIIAGGIAVASTAYVDDARSKRELDQSERQGWRTTLATEDRFERVDLAGQDLNGFYLRLKDLSEANLTGTHLAGSTFNEVDFTDANMSSADLIGAYVNGATFRGATLEGAALDNATFTNADFSGVDVSKARSTNGLNIGPSCFDYSTKFPPGVEPNLDWRGCWTGFSGNAAIAERPELNLSCPLDEPLNYLYLLFKDVQSSRDAQCDYFHYLRQGGNPGSDTEQASRGNYACREMRSGQDLSFIASVVGPAAESGNDASGKTLVFAAAHYLCQDQMSRVQSELR
jgi:uncharacterized protein YjbI with pentapeptide repeats